MDAKRGLKDFIDEWRRERPDVDLTAFSIAAAIKQIDLQTEAEFRRLSADFGIGPGDLRVLFALRRSGVANPRRPTDLFQSLLVTSGAVTKQVDRLEAQGGPRSVKDVLRLVLEVETVDRSDPDQTGPAPIGFGHMRFVVAMQFNHRKMFLDAIGDRWNKSYLRCIKHLKRLMAHVPTAIVNQRLVFMSLFINASLAAREAAFESDPTGGKLWGREEALENLIGAIARSLEAD